MAACMACITPGAGNSWWGVPGKISHTLYKHEKKQSQHIYILEVAPLSHLLKEIRWFLPSHERWSILAMCFRWGLVMSTYISLRKIGTSFWSSGPPKLVPPPKFKMTPEKWWERKTTSYWVPVTFQGRAVSFCGVELEAIGPFFFFPGIVKIQCPTSFLGVKNDRT